MLYAFHVSLYFAFVSCREMVASDVVTRTCGCLKISLNQIHTLLPDDANVCQEGAALNNALRISTEGARCLRNACAGCHRNQLLVAR